MVVDLGRVEAGEGNGRKERGEQAGARFGQLIESERAARELGEDGEQPGARRRLHHPVSRRDGGGMGRDQAERDRSRKLLEGLAFGRAPRMRWQKAGDLRQRDKQCSRRTGFAEKRLSVFAQEQDGRCLAGVIGRLPVPGAARVGSAERGFHSQAQGHGVNAHAAFHMGQQQARRREDRRRRLLIGAERKGCGSGRCRYGHHVHGKALRRAGQDRARAALSLDRTDSNPSRPPSASRRTGRGRHDKSAPAIWRGASTDQILRLSDQDAKSRPHCRDRAADRHRRDCHRRDGRRA
jgi:hypothetical protein